MLIVLAAGSPGALIGGIVGARRWQTHPIAGTVVGGLVGFVLSLAVAFVGLLVLVK